jgi:4a-hydroxytetrahydrobiopterin dehydratase
MTKLSSKKCVPCVTDTCHIADSEISEFKPQIPEWTITTRNAIRMLTRTFEFKDFAEALAFTVMIGELAEEEQHHPEIVTEWGRVTVTWWTHSVRDLHSNDFIMAAKTDDLFSRRT